MALRANIVVSDGKATPLVHTFTPTSVTGPSATFTNRSGGLVAGYEKITVKTDEPKNAQSYGRTTIRFDLPLLASVSGSTPGGYDPVPNKIASDFCEITFRSHALSSEARRKDLRTMVVNFFANDANVIAAVDKQEPIS